MANENIITHETNNSKGLNGIRIYDITNHNEIGYVCINDNVIDLLMIDRDYRGKGYGKLLLHKAECLIAKNYNNAFVTPILHSPCFTATPDFYKKRGYKHQLFQTRMVKSLKPIDSWMTKLLIHLKI